MLASDQIWSVRLGGHHILILLAKEFLDLGTHEDKEEGIFEIQPRTHGALLLSFPDSLKFFHAEIYVTNIFIELFQIQDCPAFVRTSLKFKYCKV